MTRNISFSRSSAVSTLFGVNWASVATKLMSCGKYELWDGIKDRACLVSQRELAGLIGREVDRHVDVVEIKDRQNTLTCSNDLARPSEPVLHTSASGGDEHQIDKDRLVPFDVSFGCLDFGLGLIAPGVRCHVGSLGCFKFVAAAICCLLRDISALHQLPGALIVGSGEIQITLALDYERVRLRQCPFGFQHLCLRIAQLSFCFRGRDSGNDLSRRNLVAFIHLYLGEPPRVFGGDVDLGGLEPPIRFHDPLGHIAAAQAIYQCFYLCAGFFHGVWLLRLRVAPDGQCIKQQDNANHSRWKDATNAKIGGSVRVLCMSIAHLHGRHPGWLPVYSAAIDPLPFVPGRRGLSVASKSKISLNRRCPSALSLPVAATVD